MDEAIETRGERLADLATFQHRGRSSANGLSSARTGAAFWKAFGMSMSSQPNRRSNGCWRLIRSPGLRVSGHRVGQRVVQFGGSAIGRARAFVRLRPAIGRLHRGAATSIFSRRPTQWVVEEGSALDADYLARLGHFDIVYSWGVLHHTGRMWQALENAQLPVAPGGRLFIAIYNDNGSKSRRWARIKHAYNNLPRLCCERLSRCWP